MFTYVKKTLKVMFVKWKLRNKVRIAFSANITPSSEFEEMSQIFPNVTFHGKLGMGSYIGSNSYLSADIGRFTSIANNVRCNSGIHPYKEPFVSTSPCFISLNEFHLQCGSTFATEQLFEEQRYVDQKRNIAVKIGNDCWIGEGVFFVGGITISDGAMILAHAVVTKDIPPYAIVGGVPAKIIGYRYNPQMITFLLKTQWWNNSIEWFNNNWRLFSSIDKFKQYHINKWNTHDE